MPTNPNDNPFASPTAHLTDSPTPDVGQQANKPPFAHQAVRFSLYAPVLLLATNLVVRESLGHHHPGTKVFAVVSIITIAVAFFLGIAGIIGSFRRFSLWSILLGILGTLLNGIILAGAARLLWM